MKNIFRPVAVGQRYGILSRPNADRVALVVFFAALVSCMLFLPTAMASDPPVKTTTVSTTRVETDSKGLSRRTETTQRTVANLVPTAWERTFGDKTPFWTTLGLSLLFAFLSAAIVQRVLLGHYAFSLGPLSVPEITADQFSKAAESALSSSAASSDESEGMSGGDEPSDGEAPEEEEESKEKGERIYPPLWTTVGDPNLALAGWRIDFESELRSLAAENGIAVRSYMAIGRLLNALIDKSVIDREAAPGLRELLALANSGVHGAAVDPSVLTFLRTEGMEVLRYLRSLHRLS